LKTAKFREAGGLMVVAIAIQVSNGLFAGSFIREREKVAPQKVLEKPVRSVRPKRLKCPVKKEGGSRLHLGRCEECVRDRACTSNVLNRLRALANACRDRKAESVHEISGVAWGGPLQKSLLVEVDDGAKGVEFIVGHLTVRMG
jgi:hypothetical protein